MRYPTVVQISTSRFVKKKANKITRFAFKVRGDLKVIFRFVWSKRPESVSEPNPFRSRETPNTNPSEPGGRRECHKRKSAAFSSSTNDSFLVNRPLVSRRHRCPPRVAEPTPNAFYILNAGFVLFKNPVFFKSYSLLTWERRKHKSHRPCA